VRWPPQAFVDTIWLGVIWRSTGDLSGAAVAAMLLYSVDYHHLHQRVNTKAGKAGKKDGVEQGGSSRSGGPSSSA
jgi:hypothetical protein